ncbi:hypothetical protein C8J57DRAFT_1321703 [Mycena rebaudengoi]|nr:hypothetical protein C8J57DRAFT_1321703 [Mycena rebaudengoi]
MSAANLDAWRATVRARMLEARAAESGVAQTQGGPAPLIPPAGTSAAPRMPSPRGELLAQLRARPPLPSTAGLPMMPRLPPLQSWPPTPPGTQFAGVYTAPPVVTRTTAGAAQAQTTSGAQEPMVGAPQAQPSGSRQREGDGGIEDGTPLDAVAEYTLGELVQQRQQQQTQDEMLTLARAQAEMWASGRVGDQELTLVSLPDVAREQGWSAELQEGIRRALESGEARQAAERSARVALAEFDERRTRAREGGDDDMGVGRDEAQSSPLGIEGQAAELLRRLLAEGDTPAGMLVVEEEVDELMDAVLEPDRRREDQRRNEATAPPRPVRRQRTLRTEGSVEAYLAGEADADYTREIPEWVTRGAEAPSDVAGTDTPDPPAAAQYNYQLPSYVFEGMEEEPDVRSPFYPPPVSPTIDTPTLPLPAVLPNPPIPALSTADILVRARATLERATPSRATTPTPTNSAPAAARDDHENLLRTARAAIAQERERLLSMQERLTALAAVPTDSPSAPNLDAIRVMLREQTEMLTRVNGVMTNVGAQFGEGMGDESGEVAAMLERAREQLRLATSIANGEATTEADEVGAPNTAQNSVQAAPPQEEEQATVSRPAASRRNFFDR